MIHKTFDIQVEEKNEDGGRITINTGGLDRDRDRVFPSGGRIDDYMKNPVVQWGHNYRDPWATVGNTTKLEITQDSITADFELRPPANESDPQNIVRLLWEGGWIRTASIGFNPVEKEENEEGGSDFTDWELLEWSLVPVPANQSALRLAAKALGDDSVTVTPLPEFDSDEIKRVIAYHRYPLADKGTAWDGPAQIRQADAAVLRRICAWYDAENPDIKGSYKLPHHLAASGHSTVWRGVTAAMGALLGARGGVNIPSGDRRGVYNHLARHYRDFDEEPPEFKVYAEDELDQLFPDEHKDADADGEAQDIEPVSMNADETADEPTLTAEEEAALQDAMAQFIDAVREITGG